MDPVANRLIVETLRLNKRKDGSYNTGLFQPVLLNNKVYVEHNGGMVRVDKLPEHLQFLRANSTGLPKEAYESIGTTIKENSEPKRSAYADLTSKGLVTNLNSVGIFMHSERKQSSLDDAQQNMTGIADQTTQRVEFDYDSVPMPATFVDVDEDFRTIAALAREGYAFNTKSIALATQSIQRKLEYNVFQGGIAFNSQTVYGYTNSPNRETGVLTYDWSTATGAQILTDVNKIGKAVDDNNIDVPVVKMMIYIPVSWNANLNNRFDTNSDKTIRSVLLDIDWIEDIKTSSKQVANHVNAVAMNQRYVNLIRGSAITPIIWTSDGGLMTHIKLLAIESPMITDDFDGSTGVFDFVKS